MRNIKTVSALVILLALPTLASAVTLTNLDGTANCDTWSADLTIDFRANAMMARVEYAVVLQDASGAEVDRFDFSEFVDIPDVPTATLTFTGAWSTVLDGNYTVTGDFIVFDVFGDGYNTSTGSFTTDLACGEASGGDDPIVPAACLYRSRFWFRNPTSWPVTSLEVGGKTMDQDELMAVLARRGNRFLMFRLMRELISAKLNLANGGSDEIAAIVAEADIYLANRPQNRREARRSHRLAMRLTVALFKYNRGGCTDGGPDGVTMEFGGSFNQYDVYDSDDKASVEVMTLGTVKAMYR